MRRPSRKPVWQKAIARERIGILFGLAEKEFLSHPQRSHRYAELARRIAKRYNVKLGKAHRRQICRKCGHYLKAGANCRIRTQAKQRALIVACLDCGNLMRFPYRRERKK